MLDQNQVKYFCNKTTDRAQLHGVKEHEI